MLDWCMDAPFQGKCLLLLLQLLIRWFPLHGPDLGPRRNLVGAVNPWIEGLHHRLRAGSRPGHALLVSIGFEVLLLISPEAEIGL